MTKSKIKSICIELSKTYNTSKKTCEKLEKEIESIKNNPNTDKEYLNAIEQKLKDILKEKTEAAILRSKCKWFSEREVPSSYFFN